MKKIKKFYGSVLTNNLIAHRETERLFAASGVQTHRDAAAQEQCVPVITRRRSRYFSAL